MSPQSSEQRARQMLAERQAKETESLATTGLTLEQRRQKRVEENLAALGRLKTPLAMAGVTFSNDGSYLERGTPDYKRALPIFYANFDGDYPEDIQIYMLQHLACREAAQFRPALVLALKSSSARRDEFRYRLAVAINAMSSAKDLDENLMLARDRSLGMARMGLLRGIARSRSEAALRTLDDLRDDPDLHKEVTAILYKKSKYAVRKAKPSDA